jgi:hypothetical protein
LAPEEILINKIEAMEESNKSKAEGRVMCNRDPKTSGEAMAKITTKKNHSIHHMGRNSKRLEAIQTTAINSNTITEAKKPSVRESALATTVALTLASPLSSFMLPQVARALFNSSEFLNIYWLILIDIKLANEH